MKVGLLQVDGKLPNLALMKLASWHRKKGDDVRFIDLSSIKADRWYGSKIFMGGSGYDVKQSLPKEIDCQVPDYDLFKTDYSMGFTSRGCIRDCGFCIVKEKEGNFYDVDFSDQIKHSKFMCMDNNFLASKHWKEKLQFFIDNKIKVNFNQGLDIRLIDDEKAKMLSKVKYYNQSFSRRTIYFAFDDINLRVVFKKKLEILLRHIKNPDHILVYILVGFNSTFAEDMERFEIVKSYGCFPFIMIYNNRKNNQKLRDFAKWVNKRYFKIVPFEKYDRLWRGKNGHSKKI